MTLNESAMIIDFDAYLDTCGGELRSLEDGEIIAKFISVDTYNELLENTGISTEDYSYSDYLDVFKAVKSHILKSLSQFREYIRVKYPKRPAIPGEAQQVYNAFTDLFDYEEDVIECMSAEEIIEMFKSREYYDRFNEEFKNEHPYPRFLHECDLAAPAMIYTANL